MKRLSNLLTENELTFKNFEQISRIAFRYKMEELMSKVMTFIDNNFDHFVAKDEEELKLLYESTDGRLFKVMANNYRKINAEYSKMKTHGCSWCGYSD